MGINGLALIKQNLFVDGRAKNKLIGMPGPLIVACLVYPCLFLCCLAKKLEETKRSAKANLYVVSKTPMLSVACSMFFENK